LTASWGDVTSPTCNVSCLVNTVSYNSTVAQWNVLNNGNVLLAFTGAVLGGSINGTYTTNNANTRNFSLVRAPETWDARTFQIGIVSYSDGSFSALIQDSSACNQTCVASITSYDSTVSFSSSPRNCSFSRVGRVASGTCTGSISSVNMTMTYFGDLNEYRSSFPPTFAPTSAPTFVPTPLPPGQTFSPTFAPSTAPTSSPSVPSFAPTLSPSTSGITAAPTSATTGASPSSSTSTVQLSDCAVLAPSEATIAALLFMVATVTTIF